MSFIRACIGEVLNAAESQLVRPDPGRSRREDTRIAPVLVSPELLSRASRIDGALLLDPAGRCFAIGVVLDGDARPECLPSRGARYNSAVRYVHASGPSRMAIVYSDDRTMDVVPLLRPRMPRDKIASAVASLEAANKEDYHGPRFFLDQHRFYLTAEQCDRANAAIERIHQTPLEVGELRIPHRAFEPDPGMDDSYLL